MRCPVLRRPASLGTPLRQTAVGNRADHIELLSIIPCCCAVEGWKYSENLNTYCCERRDPLVPPDRAAAFCPEYLLRAGLDELPLHCIFDGLGFGGRGGGI
jgi:hypothetical protein